jgi:hypothetical protein
MAPPRAWREEAAAACPVDGNRSVKQIRCQNVHVGRECVCGTDSVPGGALAGLSRTTGGEIHSAKTFADRKQGGSGSGKYACVHDRHTKCDGRDLVCRCSTRATEAIPVGPKGLETSADVSSRSRRKNGPAYKLHCSHREEEHVEESVVTRNSKGGYRNE